MASRLDLHAELANILASINYPQNVYFQPPESVRMKYPCIVYKRNSGWTRFADNKPYIFEDSYEVTVIDRDPDSPIIRAIAMHFPKCRYSRHFVNANLYHDVYTLYWFTNNESNNAGCPCGDLPQ